eukprot:gene5957-9956_t
MRRENQCCGNEKCKTSITPLWRKGWTNKEGKSVMLCNACGLHYKKGHFCQFCQQIYKESEADDKENPWIGCERCSRWVHKNCDVEKPELKDGESYKCAECRNNPFDKIPTFEKKRKTSAEKVQKEKKKKKVYQPSFIQPAILVNPSSNPFAFPIRVPQEIAFDSQDSSSSNEEVYEPNEEIIVDVEEMEKKFSGFSGSLLKFGTLCAIAECEMKMFSNN